MESKFFRLAIIRVNSRAVREPHKIIGSTLIDIAQYASPAADRFDSVTLLMAVLNAAAPAKVELLIKTAWMGGPSDDSSLAAVSPSLFSDAAWALQSPSSTLADEPSADDHGQVSHQARACHQGNHSPNSASVAWVGREPPNAQSPPLLWSSRPHSKARDGSDEGQRAQSHGQESMEWHRQSLEWQLSPDTTEVDVSVSFSAHTATTGTKAKRSGGARGELMEASLRGEDRPKDARLAHSSQATSNASSTSSESSSSSTPDTPPLEPESTTPRVISVSPRPNTCFSLSVSPGDTYTPAALGGDDWTAASSPSASSGVPDQSNAWNVVAAGAGAGGAGSECRSEGKAVGNGNLRRSRKKRLSRRLFHEHSDEQAMRSATGADASADKAREPRCGVTCGTGAGEGAMDGACEGGASIGDGVRVRAKLVIDALIHLPIKALTSSPTVAGVRVLAHLWSNASDQMGSRGHSRKLGQTAIAPCLEWQNQARGTELTSPLQSEAEQQPAALERGHEVRLEARADQEARVLEVLVETGRHLPKTDTLGKCDGFCEIKWRDFVGVTRVKKNTYSPDWNERFEFEFVGEVTGDLVLTLKDWDRFSSPDLVGQVSISPAQIEEMARGGGVAQALDVLTAQGRPVTGHDKSACVITVKLALRSASGAPTLPPVAPAPAAQDAVDKTRPSLEEQTAAPDSAELKWGTAIDTQLEVGNDEEDQILVFSTIGVDAMGNDMIVLGTSLMPTVSLGPSRMAASDLVETSLQVYDEGQHALRSSSGECALLAPLPAARPRPDLCRSS